MIFNTTYNNKDYDKESNIVLGEKHSIFKRLKMGGIGSGRLFISNLSENLSLGKIKFSEIDYANIELRPKGIIVHYTNKLERFSWLIPYYRLVFYNTDFFSIHSNGSFINFTKNKNYSENKKFIKKINKFKNEFLGGTYYDSL
jgi:hypothetical protein